MLGARLRRQVRFFFALGQLRCGGSRKRVQIERFSQEGRERMNPLGPRQKQLSPAILQNAADPLGRMFRVDRQIGPSALSTAMIAIIMDNER